MSITPICDPKQALAISLYRDPKSDTFGNLKQSLIQAGYSPKYAENGFTDKPWMENIRDTVETIQKAEKNLKKAIMRDIDTEDIDNLSKSKLEMLKMQQDTSKFVLKTLAKSKYDEEKEQAKQNIQINITKYGDDIKVSEAEITE